MSDSEDYEYEYDESDQDAMDDGGDGDGDEQSFEYTDDEGGPCDDDDGEVALENAYYNAKAERDAGELEEARATFEGVVRREAEQLRRAAGVADDAGSGGGEGGPGAGDGAGAEDLTPLRHHGPWGFKAIKQLIKLHLRALDGPAVVRDYARLLRVAGAPDAAVSPNALEKGVHGMLDRVSHLVGNAPPPSAASGDPCDPRVLARR